MENNPTQDSSAQNINNIALEYMEQKYGEKFEYVSPWGNSMSGTHELIVSCVSMPGQEIVVQVENYKKDDKVFRDNFLAVKYQQQSTEFFKECAVDVFGEATAFFTPTKNGLSTELSVDSSLEQYLSDTRTRLVILVEVKESDFASESQAEELSRLIGKYGSHYLLKIVIVKDGEYGSYDAVSLEDVIGKKESARCVVVDNSTGTAVIGWFGE